MSPTSRNPFAAFWIREATVVTVIVVNAVVLFLDAFPAIHATIHKLLFWIDYGCLLFFIVEATIKIRGDEGFSGYWRSNWNKLDFMIVITSLPLLVSPFVSAGLEDFAILLLLRLGRLLRFSRLMRSVPHATEIWLGVIRALKASVAIFLVMFVLNLILAMGANLLFYDPTIPATEEFFGDPIAAFYSLFKVFTIEGWYEIPDKMKGHMADEMITVMRGYFMISVLVGGLLGLSMANAVFVDEMTADNTDEVERMVTELRRELQEFREEMRQSRGPGPGRF